MNTYKATEAMAGSLSGSVILQMTPKRLHPSILPASSSSVGRVLKKSLQHVEGNRQSRCGINDEEPEKAITQLQLTENTI